MELLRRNEFSHAYWNGISERWKTKPALNIPWSDGRDKNGRYPSPLIKATVARQSTIKLMTLKAELLCVLPPPAFPGLKVMKLGRAPTSEEMHFFRNLLQRKIRLTFTTFFLMFRWSQIFFMVSNGFYLFAENHPDWSSLKGVRRGTMRLVVTPSPLATIDNNGQ